jgi:hypothetical protein
VPEPPPVCHSHSSDIGPGGWLRRKPPDLKKLGRHSIDVVSTLRSGAEGSYSLEPLPVYQCLSSGPRNGLLWPLWKLLDMEQVKQHSINVVKSRSQGMSRRCSPRPGTALTPFDPFPDLHPPISGLKPDRKLRWKPLDVKMRR